MISKTSIYALVGLAAAIAACGNSARAEVLCVTGANLAVPQTSEGLYLNLITGVSGTSEGSTPGFDIDIYAAQSTTPSGQLKFYWGPAATGGAGVVTAGDSYAVLVNGEVVGPASLFSRAAFSGDTSAWQAGTMGHLGMRFPNENTGVINYGWIRLATSASLGFPAVIAEWCYDDTGAAITTPIFISDFVFDDGFES